MALLALCALLAATGGLWRLATFASGKSSAPDVAQQPIGPSAYTPATTKAALPAGRTYFIQQRAASDELMYADASHADEIAVATLPNSFGSEDTDVVAALALAPGQRYLAIDGQQDHGDMGWVASTAGDTLRQTPADALGNFMSWLPDGEHFLFRPFLPAGPYAGAWNPGLWIVDAATGTHVNLPLPDGMGALNVIDAAPTPDGAHILLSLTAGLGTGSTVWLVTPDGMHSEALFRATGDIGLFAWSPNGRQVAYEQIDDSTTPFRPAGLWVMAAATTQRSQIGTADGGHGYALAWSPDGARLAFVTRLNPGDGAANGAAGALVSAIAVVNVTAAESGAASVSARTTIAAGPRQTGMPRNIDPAWSAAGQLEFAAMPASAATSGEALMPATLFAATLARSAGNIASFTVAPAGGNGQALDLAAAIVAIVP